MTKRVHLVTGERPESAKAYASFIAYRDMPNRSISKLHHQFLEQAAAYKQQGEQNGGDGPLQPPPTTSKKMLLEWSAAFGWAQRVRDWQLECDLARRQEYLRQIEAQARQNAALLQQVGTGMLAVAAVVLGKLVDAKTGELLQSVPPRDLPAIGKTGAELLQLAMAQAGYQPGGDSTRMETILREADPETKRRILDGLRAAFEYQQGQDGWPHGGAA